LILPDQRQGLLGLGLNLAVVTTVLVVEDRLQVVGQRLDLVVDLVVDLVGQAVMDCP
jgi:hypothetical protein